MHPAGRPQHATSHSQPIERASHAEPASVEHIRINHRGAHIAMPEPFPNRANVVPRLEQMGGKRMPQRLPSCALVHARPQHGLAYGILKHGLVKVVPSPLPGVRLSLDPRRRKPHCHGHSRPALGSFRPKASRSSTQPAPSARSASCCFRTRSRCSRSGKSVPSRKSVLRSFRPLPSRTRSSRRSKSSSFARSRAHSKSRSPAPRFLGAPWRSP